MPELCAKFRRTGNFSGSTYFYVYHKEFKIPYDNDFYPDIKQPVLHRVWRFMGGM